MEHPVKEIPGIITSLCRGTPDEQESTLRSYFMPNASFSHPFCRVPSFSKGAVPLAGSVDSLWVILCIYRWYRTMSPNIEVSIDSAVFDQRTGLLYVTARQTFAVWFIPFYKAPVRLVTVLQLTSRVSRESGDGARNGAIETNGSTAPLAGPGQERSRYYIASQEDLYSLGDCLQFLAPGLGPLLWFGWQLYSSVVCVFASLVFLPLYLVLNKGKAKAKVG